MRNIIERVLQSDFWYCVVAWVLAYPVSVIAHFIFMPAGLAAAFHVFWLVAYAVSQALVLIVLHAWLSEPT